MKNKRENMHYHLRDHIYVAQFQDEFILLDTKQDKYTICFKEFSGILVDLLKGKYPTSDEKLLSSGDSQFFSQEQIIIQKLINDNVIEKRENPYPFRIDRKLDSEGVSNVDWSLPLENKKVHLNLSVLRALVTLLQVNFYMKVRGFYSTIQLIKKSCKIHSNYIVPQEEDLRDLANVVNKACLIYPTRTKCLEWAMTFVLLALRRKWKCNLEIGVQNYPFLAHAWVECDGKVVMDSQDLREGLAIILNEPFRKLTI